MTPWREGAGTAPPAKGELEVRLLRAYRRSTARESPHALPACIR